jgi:cytochrome c oxidase subunit 3
MRPVPPRNADVVRPCGDAGAVVPGAGTMGVWLLVASLAVFFLASLAGYVAVRVQADLWPPAGMPQPQPALWISTVLLVASSATIHRALHSIRRGNQRGLTRWMTVTVVLAVGFLASQARAWLDLFSDEITARSNLWAFTFYGLTALHAAHVMGGLVPLVFTTFRARTGRYSWASHAGVRNCAIYWHFLDAVWITIFALLVVVR